MDVVQSLENLFTSFDRQADGRWWIGARPDGPSADLPKIIAGKLGYPTARDDPFVHDRLLTLSWTQAVRVLAVAGTVSLAYGPWRPRNEELDQAKAALKDMSYDAAFLSNGLWDGGEFMGWTPLTSATFDCGLIGFDAENAFIFWVEEED